MSPFPFSVVAVVITATSVTGCSEYLDRKDTLLLGAGNAVETNIATHVIDPWPKEAQSTYWPTGGRHAQRAVEAYDCRPNKPRDPDYVAGGFGVDVIAARASARGAPPIDCPDGNVRARARPGTAGPVTAGPVTAGPVTA